MGEFFYPSTESGQFTHNGGTAYASNYRYSNLFSYVADGFCSFTTAQVQILTGVPASGTTAKYAILTNDMITSSNYMGSNPSNARMAKATDYARSMGVYANSNGYVKYWTSSATGDNSSTIIIVKDAAEYAYRLSGIRLIIALDTTKVTL